MSNVKWKSYLHVTHGIFITVLLITPTLLVTFWFVFLQPGRSCRSRSSRSCRSRSWLERPLVAAVEVDLNDPLFYNLDVRDETRWDEMTQHIYFQDIDTFVIWRGMFVQNVRSQCWMLNVRLKYRHWHFRDMKRNVVPLNCLSVLCH